MRENWQGTIFFDWYHADFADHVGIVEYVENGYVHTIEGNSGDSVQRKVKVIEAVRSKGMDGYWINSFYVSNKKIYRI